MRVMCVCVESVFVATTTSYVSTKTHPCRLDHDKTIVCHSRSDACTVDNTFCVPKRMSEGR